MHPTPTSLLIALVRPAVTAVAGDLWRRWKLDGRTFSYKPVTKSQLIKNAENDLRILLGKNALLSTTLAALLQDLGSAGLLELIAKDAFYQAEDSGVRLQFETMYARHFARTVGSSPGVSCEDLYDYIRNIFRDSIRYQIRPDLLYIFDTYFAQNNKKRITDIEKLAEVLNAARPHIVETIGLSGKAVLRLDKRTKKPISGLVRKSYPDWLYHSPELVSKFIRAMAKSLIDAYDHVRLDGPAERSVKCKIDNLYVPARLVAAEYFVRSNSLEVRNGTEIRYDEALKNIASCVILGDPGGGKSTLGQRVCLDALKNAASDGRSPLAVRVEIRRLSRAESALSQNLVEFITSEMLRQSSAFDDNAEVLDMIRHLLFFGRMIIVFDGIDEIINATQRREVIDMLTRVAGRYSHNKFFYTCRKTDFLTTPLTDIPIFLLQSFTRQEVKLYFRSASQYVFKRSKSDIDRVESNFLKQVSRQAPEFVTSPLLLALVVWIFNTGQRIPDNRIELYSECSELLFRRWDSLKEIDPEIPDPHLLFQLVTEIARHLFLISPDDGEPSGEWLKGKAYEFFRRIYQSDAENRALAASERFVRHLIGRSWILRERSAGIFEFTHRTFMEYFFARWLDDEFRSIESLVVAVALRIRAGEWSIPIHLAFQLKTAGKLKSTEELTISLMRVVDEIANDGAALSNCVRFLIGSIGYLQPTESSMSRITRVITSTINSKDEWYSTIGEIVKSQTELKASITQGIYQAIGDEVASERGATVGFVIDWLYACYLASRPRDSIEFSDRILRLTEMREISGHNFMDRITSRASMRPSMQKMIFDLTGDVVASVGATGLEIWKSSVESEQRLDWRFVDFGLGICECIDVLEGRSVPQDCAYVSLFKEVAKVFHRQEGLGIEGGFTVTCEFDHSGLASAIRSISSRVEVLLPLGTALMGFHELSGRLNIRSDTQTAELALRMIMSHAGLPSNFREFVDGWIAGERSMFDRFVKIRGISHLRAFYTSLL